MIRLRPQHTGSGGSSHCDKTSLHSIHGLTAAAAAAADDDDDDDIVVVVAAAAADCCDATNHQQHHHKGSSQARFYNKRRRSKSSSCCGRILSFRILEIFRHYPHRRFYSHVVVAAIAIAAFLLLLFGIAVVMTIVMITNTSTTRSSSSRRDISKLPPMMTMNMKEYLQQSEHMLQPMDYEYYTIRINTWERSAQLQLSLRHHLTCDSVLQIQIVWCIHQSIDIPDWLIVLEQTTQPIVVRGMSYPRIVIERHVINSLNERFHPLDTTIIHTAAILSIDDDVVRPCIAIDSTFYIWLRNPNRQVGFDARSHEIVPSSSDQNTMSVIHDKKHHKHHPHHPHHHSVSTSSDAQQQWKYSYMSVTEASNLYSLTLTRYSFFHQHYMTIYNQMSTLQTIRTTIDTNFNCEDIAMSLLISSICCSTSSNTGRVPLLANLWAVKSQIKMYVEKKISGTNDHKHIRDQCVHNFSHILQLQKPPPPVSMESSSDPDAGTTKYDSNHDPDGIFHTVPLHLGTLFEYGDIPDNWNDMNVPAIEQLTTSLQDAIRTVKRWKTVEQHVWMKEFKVYRDTAIQPIFDAGYIEKTIPWKRKFHK